MNVSEGLIYELSEVRQGNGRGLSSRRVAFVVGQSTREVHLGEKKGNRNIKLGFHGSPFCESVQMRTMSLGTG